MHHFIFLITINSNNNCVIDLTSLNMYTTDVAAQLANISWTATNSEPPFYNLTVMSANTKPESFRLSRPFFVFNTSKDAPPCEVYNFSVTATYVGATYTGAGCSEPGPVISRMLPSLPDITHLESSLNYSLIKKLNNVTLITYFMVKRFVFQSL